MNKELVLKTINTAVNLNRGVRLYTICFDETAEHCKETEVEYKTDLELAHLLDMVKENYNEHGELMSDVNTKIIEAMVI